MPYTVTTNKSWFGRLGSSFGGILFGLIILIAATCLMYWNEGRTVRTGGAINEAQMTYVDMPDINKVDPSFDGKLVYATGKAETKDILEDTAFGVKSPGPAIKLSRNVLYYQWVESSKEEKKKKLGGGEETVTVYSYAKKWVSKPVDSSEFADPDYQGVNTVITTVDSDNETVTAENVTFGAYVLPELLKSAIGGMKEFAPTLTEEQLKALNNRIAAPARMGMQKAQGLQKDKAGRTQHVDVSSHAIVSNVHIDGRTLYLGSNFGMPEIGDMKVTFFEAPPANISIIAKVVGDTFEKFRASNGTSFFRLSMGTVSPDNMFGDARSSNNTMAWLLRGLGVVLCIAGIAAVLGPISVLASVVPLFGDIAAAGTGIVAFIVGLAWSLIIIAISWIRFRPVLAFSLIGIAIAGLALVIYRGHKKKQAAAAPQQ